MKVFSFDKETLLEELKTNPKWSKYLSIYNKEDGDGDLSQKFNEDCTGCCNPSTLMFVLADTEEEAKEMTFKNEAGMCGDCMATELANTEGGTYELHYHKDTTAPAGKIYKVPACESCGEPLEKVQFNDYTTYTFNAKIGQYENTGGDAESKCNECEAKLGDEVGDFVGDYQATKLIKEKKPTGETK